MSNPRQGVKFDLSDAEQALRVVPPPTRVDPETAKAAAANAKEAGFGSRAGGAEKIDRRTLRQKRTHLTEQLAMKVSPATRKAFTIAAAGYATSNDFIEYLLALHEKHAPKA